MHNIFLNNIFTFTFKLIHLADTFIQSNLHFQNAQYNDLKRHINKMHNTLF